jgi:hypothetical protein
MTKPITLYSGSAGLNTRLDPQRLSSDPAGIELAQAVNVSIDDKGLITLRYGGGLISSAVYSSCFCDGGDCFVVQERTSDAAILKVVSLSPFTTAGVRSGLTKGLRMAWAQTGQDTFYSNGTENGYIRAGVSAAWPVNTNDNPDDDRQFLTEIPKANHIAFRQHGQVLLAVGDSILANDFPFLYGAFCLRSGAIAAFESDVTMLVAVGDGFYASDGRRTWFFRQMEGWYNYRQELVEDAPALEGSAAIDLVKLSEIGMESQDFGAVWASTNGVCLGAGNGQMANRTKAKVVYPDGYTAGACLIKDDTVIHTARP